MTPSSARTSTNVCGSVGHAIHVVGPDGELRDTVATGDGTQPTNCCLVDGHLYVTFARTGQLVSYDLGAAPLPLYEGRVTCMRGRGTPRYHQRGRRHGRRPRACRRQWGGATVARSPSADSDIARRRMERRMASGRKSDARWREVLDGAARVFQHLGYPQTTLEDIATEVGINRATLYYYVGTKEELLVSLLHEPIAQMRQDLEEIVARDTPAQEKLAAALRSYVAAMAERPELFIFVGENIHKVMGGREATDIQEQADRWGRLLAGVIADGAKDGEFRDDLDPQLATLAIAGMVNWTYRWFDPAGAKTLPEIGEVFVEMALSSLSPVAAARG